MGGISKPLARHTRLPWEAFGRSQTVVHCPLPRLRGEVSPRGALRKRHAEDYRRAKFEFDMPAAVTAMERCLDEPALDRIADAFLSTPTTPRLVLPHPAFDDDDAIGRQEPVADRPTNAIPFAYANYLAETMGCEVDEQIVQRARVGRTKLTTWSRFLWQPSFTGEVVRGQPYIIVDDVVSTGGTFAALRSYIVENGGQVVLTTALANRSGQDQKFEIDRATYDVLLSRCGGQLDSFWRETIGYDAHCFTDREGRFLLREADDFRSAFGCRAGDEILQRIRDRLAEAAAKGR